MIQSQKAPSQSGMNVSVVVPQTVPNPVVVSRFATLCLDI